MKNKFKAFINISDWDFTPIDDVIDSLIKLKEKGFESLQSNYSRDEYDRESININFYGMREETEEEKSAREDKEMKRKEQVMINELKELEKLKKKYEQV